MNRIHVKLLEEVCLAALMIGSADLFASSTGTTKKGISQYWYNFGVGGATAQHGLGEDDGGLSLGMSLSRRMKETSVCSTVG